MQKDVYNYSIRCLTLSGGTVSFVSQKTRHVFSMSIVVRLGVISASAAGAAFVTILGIFGIFGYFLSCVDLHQILRNNP